MLKRKRKLPKTKKPKFKGCSIEQFRKHCLKNNGIGFMYVVLCEDDTESFVKVGITSNDVETRFKSIPYRCTVLKLIRGSSTFIYFKEQGIHKALKEQRYIPQKRFGGRFECYPVGVLGMLGIEGWD